jgi:hypothetical protein
VKKLGIISQVMTQCGVERAGYISLLMATEQVNGIVHVTWTRATFLEFINAIQVEELGELDHFSSLLQKSSMSRRMLDCSLSRLGWRSTCC